MCVSNYHDFLGLMRYRSSIVKLVFLSLSSVLAPRAACICLPDCPVLYSREKERAERAYDTACMCYYYCIGVSALFFFLNMDFAFVHMPYK